MNKRFEVSPAGEIITKKDSRLAKAVRETARKLFFITTEKIIIVAATKTLKGVEYDIKYEGNLVVPDLMDRVAWTQEVARQNMERTGEDYVEFTNALGYSEPDILGFKRLNRYLSRRLGNNNA